MVEQTCQTNPYVELMYGEYRDWTCDEKATKNKALWRSSAFKCEESTAMDIEIGTGNGIHFAHLCQKHPERKILGLELKYKTTIQSIRRSLRAGCSNGHMARIPAQAIRKFFGKEEVNNVYIHFPDPWPKKRHHRRRLIQDSFIRDLFWVMRPDCFVEFKTDDPEYFKWAVNIFKKSSFEISFFTEDLHKSFLWDKNFITYYESLFIRKNQPIFYCRLKK